MPGRGGTEAVIVGTVYWTRQVGLAWLSLRVTRIRDEGACFNVEEETSREAVGVSGREGKG
jgi:hypothetical protein